MIEEKNAIIESAEIFIEGHGILTAYVHLNYHGAGQGFGGYSLNGGPYAAIFIKRVLEVAGVDNWARLPNKAVRVRAEHVKIHEIGHIIKDVWFNPSKEFSAIKKLEKTEKDTYGLG